MDHKVNWALQVQYVKQRVRMLGEKFKELDRMQKRRVLPDLISPTNSLCYIGMVQR